jgi:hypothetical protein
LEEFGLGGFSDLPSLDATGADLHSLGATLWLLNSNGLQIRIESTGRPIVCVRNVVSKLGTFTADFASFSHDL